MANDAKKISDLVVANTMALTDRVVVLVNANTTANVQTITLQNFANVLISTQNVSTFSATVPSNSSSTGVKGQFAYDATHFYVCIANNSWIRTTMSTF